MTQGIYIWSTTAATNGSVDSSINFAEGQSPSSVNDSARALMARVAEYRKDIAGTITTGGTSTAYTLTTNEVFDTLAHMDGQKLAVRFNATNGAAPTLNVDGLGAKPIQISTTVAVGTGVILINSVWNLVYDNSAGAWIMSGVPASIQDATVNTASIAANAVTLAKMATQANTTILGNGSGGAAVPAALTVTGPTMTATTAAFPFPPAAAFKNLSIKVASNTTVTVAADFVTVTDGTAYQTLAFSSTVNLATTGADALDAGSIAIDTWYAIWAIAKADGTAKCLASTSFTAPTLPSGYTQKARIGAVQTIHGSATLYGTWQLGRRAQYVVGLAQTSALPTITSGATGTYNSTTFTGTSTSVARFVPTTASRIAFFLNTEGNAQAIALAPNASYGGFNSPTAAVPWGSSNAPTGIWIAGEFMLESGNVFFAGGANGHAQCLGWEDNI